jgi:integrase
MAKNVLARGNRLYIRLKDESGRWVRKPSPYNVGQEAEAARYRKAAQAQIDARRANGETSGPPTVRAYLATWSKDREQRGIGSAIDDRRRLETYALPYVGHLELAAVKPKHVRDLVRALKALKKEDGSRLLAPRSVIHVFRTLHNMFESALIDEHVIVNPVKVKRGELPKKVDADPEWRTQATYTVHEVERLISDVAIPVERRVQYALKALAGLRHGEMAALCWRHLDYTAEPLARVNIVQAYDSVEQETKSTKTEETRAVPMHPTLAKVLAAWKLEHWTRIYGRMPTADDFVVPTRTMRPVNVADAGHALTEDLERLELRVEAGKSRKRGGHDLRSWFQTRCIEDGADSLIVRSFTHAADKSVNGGYERFSWAAKCRELGKLKCAIRSGVVLELGPAFGTAEKKAAARWISVVTPKGLEGSKTPDTAHKYGSTTRDAIGASGAHRSAPTELVPSLGTELAEAVLAGDHERARRIAERMHRARPAPKLRAMK